MTITPEIRSLISAAIASRADLAEAGSRVSIGAIGHDPAQPEFLATALLTIPPEASVEFDFRKLAPLPDDPARDAEGRTVDLNAIRLLAIHSDQPLTVSPGTAGDWSASPLPQTLRALAASGYLAILSASRTANLANPSPTDPAQVTLLAIGDNTLAFAFAHDGIPFAHDGIQITHTPS